MFSLKHLRLWEQRRQSLQKFAQKAPQPPALKPPSTARTAGRSDRAERRFRRQPFILCFNRTGKQGAKASETGHDRERNTHPQRLSSPSPGRYLPGLFPHRTQTPQRSFQWAAAGTHATPAPNRAHSGLHAETGGVSDGGAISTLGAFCAVRKPCAAGCQNGKLCRFLALAGGAL